METGTETGPEPSEGSYGRTVRLVGYRAEQRGAPRAAGRRAGRDQLCGGHPGRPGCRQVRPPPGGRRRRFRHADRPHGGRRVGAGAGLRRRAPAAPPPAPRGRSAARSTEASPAGRVRRAQRPAGRPVPGGPRRPHPAVAVGGEQASAVRDRRRAVARRRVGERPRLRRAPPPGRPRRHDRRGGGDDGAGATAGAARDPAGRPVCSRRRRAPGGPDRPAGRRRGDGAARDRDRGQPAGPARRRAAT